MRSTRYTLLQALGKLASGSGLGYLSVLVMSPVLTRLYSPEDFGTFAVFGAFVAIASIVMGLSFELGILGAQTRTSAAHYAVSGVSASIFLGMLFTVCVMVWEFAGTPKPLPFWALLLAIASCFIAVLTTISMNWEIRQDRAGIAAKATFGSLAGRSALQAGLGIWPAGLTGLVSGEVLGRLLSWMLVGSGVFCLALRRLRRAPRSVMRHIFQNRDYITYVAPATAVETALVWLPSPLFTLLFDPLAGGFVALVQRLGSAPLTIANQSIGQLFHREAAKVIGRKNTHILKFIALFSLSGMPIVLGLMWVFGAYGQDIAGAIFGRAWREVGFVVLIFLPLFYLQFLSLLTNRIILILGYMRMKLLASLLHLMLIVLVLGVTYSLRLPWQQSIILYSALLSLSHALVFILVLFLLKGKQ